MPGLSLVLAYPFIALVRNEEFLRIKLRKKKVEEQPNYCIFQRQCLINEFNNRQNDYKRLQKESSDILNEFKLNFNEDEIRLFQDHLIRITSREKERCIKVHMNKLALLNNGKPLGQDYLNYKSQLVHNLSSYVLTPNKERLLQRGWKFCIENKVSNMMNFMTEIELNAYTRKPVISASVFKVFCRDFYAIASQMMKVSKCKNIRNVSDAEYEAIQSLKSNMDIVVTKADKGNCIVILDKKDYIGRAREILELDQFESVTPRDGVLHLHNREKQM
ncbi:unnamed protein product, partial [Didymodactylos carnosus]